MAGHSKWANIKHKKAAEDQKRGKEFSRVSRGIRGAVKDGGSGDPDANVSLRLWLDKAREINMPKDNICRAIDAGLGKGQGGALQEVVYEGFGPAGVGLIVICSTDNKNRTTADVRYAFGKADGSLGAPGSAKYMFFRDSQGKYKCKLPMTLHSSEEQQQVKNLVESLLKLEDIDAVYCAVPEINQEVEE